MADITKLFAASIKSVKTRRKDLATLLHAANSKNAENEFTKRKGKLKDMDKFEKTAHSLVNSIKELKAFLLDHQRDYLGGMGIIGSSSFMSEEERDQIDQDAHTLMQSCSSTILHLKGELHSNSASIQLIKHREAVLELLNSYLKDVCRLYSQQRAIRVKVAVDRKRMTRLKPQSSKERDRVHGENLMRRIGDSEIKQKDHPRAKTSDDQSRNRLLLEEERPSETMPEFSPEETQLFEKENERLYEEMNHMVNEVRQIEGKVIEISQLQEVFSEKVLHQASQVDKIYETAVGTTENVKEGNENIREAIKNSATFRVWILFFLVMCTFSLLFLDWYNQ